MDLYIILYNLLKSKNIPGNEVLNICSNNPILVSKLLKMIEQQTGRIKVKDIIKNSADVYKTHGDNKKILNFCGIKKRLFQIETAVTSDCS